MNDQASPRFWVIQTGDAPAAIAEQDGNYDQMFLTQLSRAGVQGAAVAAHKDEPLPPLSEVDAVLITGSACSVYERQTWEQNLEAWTRDALEQSKPLLGVCYGHQLVAQALGGEVQKNPGGYEIGTIEVSLTEDGARDPLLGGLQDSLRFSAVHGDAVVRLPQGATLLAENERCAVQAFSLGAQQWCVQFHPEFSSGVVAKYVEQRADVIRADARSRGEPEEAAVEAARRSVKPSPAGPALMTRFVNLVSGSGS